MHPDCRIWVGGLPSDISEPELYEEFSKYGVVESISIRSSPRDTFCFVQMIKRSEAELAISKLNRTPIWGTKGLQVRIAHNDSKRDEEIRGKGAFVPGQARRLLPASCSPERGEQLDRRPSSSSPPLLVACPQESRQAREAESHQRRLEDRKPERSLVRRRPVDDKDPYDLWRDCCPEPVVTHAEASRSVGSPAYRERHAEPHHDSRSGCDDRRHDDQQYDGRYREAPPSRSPYEDPRYAPSKRERPRLVACALRPRSPPPASFRDRDLSICIHNVPPDMDWLELKNLGRMYGYVAYARCYRDRDVCCGLLEFSKSEDKERAIQAIDGQSIPGGLHALKVYEGAPAEALAFQPDRGAELQLETRRAQVRHRRKQSRSRSSSGSLQATGRRHK